eukprot:5029899-Alexandrium_andersonii.AAC.1
MGRAPGALRRPAALATAGPWAAIDCEGQARSRGVVRELGACERPDGAAAPQPLGRDVNLLEER